MNEDFLKTTLIIPTRRQMRYFNVAKEQSLLSNFIRHNNGYVKIGAAIVKGNYVVSKGYNKNKSHTIQHRNNINSKYKTVGLAFIHAEIDALIGSRYSDLTGCEMFIYRQYMDESIANSRPCRSCMISIRESGIKHIYYTSPLGYHYERIY